MRDRQDEYAGAGPRFRRGKLARGLAKDLVHVGADVDDLAGEIGGPGDIRKVGQESAILLLAFAESFLGALLVADVDTNTENAGLIAGQNAYAGYVTGNAHAALGEPGGFHLRMTGLPCPSHDCRNQLAIVFGQALDCGHRTQCGGGVAQEQFWKREFQRTSFCFGPTMQANPGRCSIKASKFAFSSFSKSASRRRRVTRAKDERGSGAKRNFIDMRAGKTREDRRGDFVGCGGDHRSQSKPKCFDEVGRLEHAKKREVPPGARRTSSSTIVRIQCPQRV